jgi:Na+-transporting methylmalonyl-CoA/oxaloacetate decarboxylase gamma subunit
MALDWTWAQAGQIGGVGFGLVFLVLIILAVVIWLVGLILGKIGAGKAEAEEKKKGD